jgi:hypothetical protein
MRLVSVAALCLAAVAAVPVVAEEKMASNLDILLQKVKADKKLLVAASLELTESEAAAFWPVYDSYQSDLMKINGRLAQAILAYADAYNAGPVPDDKALSLLNEILSIEESQLKLQRDYLPRVGKVLPGAKVARYFQVEGKIRAALRYEMAVGIPLVD